MLFRLTGRLLVLLLPVAVLMSVPAWGITIEPAPFDHYEVKVPEKVQAGEEFTITFSILDRYGNEMRSGWRPDTPLTLSFSPPAALLTPSALTRDNYTPSFSFRARSDSAGPLVVQLLDGNGKELRKWTVQVAAGRPASMEVRAPDKAVAGEAVTLKLSIYDRFGNTLPEYELDTGDLILEGGASIGPGPLRRSSDGSVELPVQFNRTGQVSLVLRDRKQGLSASTGQVVVVSAPLARFEVEAGTKGVPAGEPVPITVRAVDRLGNTMTAYSREYRGVRINAAGAQVTPDLIAPTDFVEGVARARVNIRKAGRHSVQIQEVQGAEKGQFDIEVLPGPVSEIEVRTPETAVAGEPFEIVLTAGDAFGNRIDSLSAGSVIRLRTTGSGALVPDMVPSSAYRQGEAKVKVRYETAESFTINASLEGAATAPKAAVDPAREAAEKAREEALRAKRESRLREQRVSEKIQPSAAQAPPPVVQPPAKPAPAPKPAPKPAPPARTAPPPAPAPPKAASAPVKAKPPVAAARDLRPGFLDGVKVEESSDLALVSFSTNGMTDYTVSTSAKLSRKWIDLHFPTLKPDLPGHLRGGEKIVGEVYVEEIPTGGVTVSVEILPVRIGYDIYMEGDGLVLKVQRQ